MLAADHRPHRADCEGLTMHLRHSRRTLRFAIGVLLLAPVLASCGDYATDRVNNLTAGTFDRSADVDLLNAVVVAERPNSGTLIGLLVKPATSNDTDQDEPGVLSSITTDVSDEAPEFEPIEVPTGGSAQLADAEIRIDGEFEAGEFIDVTLTFDNGDELTLGVPVMPACDEYEGYDDAPGRSSDDPYSCEVEESPELEH
jgi:hypothetical protein